MAGPERLGAGHRGVEAVDRGERRDGAQDGVGARDRDRSRTTVRREAVVGSTDDDGEDGARTGFHIDVAAVVAGANGAGERGTELGPRRSVVGPQVDDAVALLRSADRHEMVAGAVRGDGDGGAVRLTAGQTGAADLLVEQPGTVGLTDERVCGPGVGTRVVVAGGADHEDAVIVVDPEPELLVGDRLGRDDLVRRVG